MSTTQILLLGALAGFTIFLGLPVGRIAARARGEGGAVSAIATGILLFLLWDVLSHGVEPVEAALTSTTDDGAGSTSSGSRVALRGGFTIGLMSLVYYDRVDEAAAPQGACSARARRRRRSSSARGRGPLARRSGSRC